MTLKEVLGSNPISCGHDLKPTFSIVIPTETEDWEWACAKYAKGTEGTAGSGSNPPPTSVSLCALCRQWMPSSVRAANEARLRAEKAKQDAEDEMNELVQRFNDGDPLFKCPSCDEIHDECDLVPIRHCPHCAQNFDASDGRNCTTCNRPFTRKVCLNGCPECLSEDEDECFLVTRVEELEE